MIIKVLGTGCEKCKKLEKLALEVVQENKLDATVCKIGDIVEILKYGVMATPALVIDEKVVISGRLPSRNEIGQEIYKYLKL